MNGISSLLSSINLAQSRAATAMKSIASGNMDTFVEDKVALDLANIQEKVGLGVLAKALDMQKNVLDILV